ncbi:MAG: TolC family protein [Sphingobacteriales bacterium]|nr:TolC family protein [Sphingobacteriales bacterium]
MVVYTGLAEIKAVEPLVIPDTAISLPPDAQQYPPDSASLQYHPIIKLHAQNIKLANWQKKLAKKQALPGFSIGYLNPSDKNTSIQNRFSLGLSVPLWWRQYKNNIQAATTQIAIAQQQSAAAQTELEIAQLQIKTQLQQSANELNYYLSSGNQNAAELATMATRFFMAGETDALVYLQTLRDAFAIKVAFLQSINNYQQANLQWQYFLLKSEQ